METTKFRSDVTADEPGFLGRVFTEPELAYARSTDDYLQRLAGRFAAKEATLKALGTGWGNGVDWKQIEITNAPSGQPQVSLTGRAAEIAAAAGVKRCLVSISHSPYLATAEVVLES